MTLGSTVQGFGIFNVQPNAAPYGIEFAPLAKLPHSSDKDAAQIKWRIPKVQSMSFLNKLPKAGDKILSEQDAPKTFE